MTEEEGRKNEEDVSMRFRFDLSISFWSILDLSYSDFLLFLTFFNSYFSSLELFIES